MATMTINGMEFNAKQLRSVTDNTVFFTVRFGVMGNSRKVRAEQSNGEAPSQNGNIAVQTDASLDLLKVQKTLIESKELEAIRKADGRMRTYLYQTCLPYEMGIMLLPIGLLPTVQAKLEAFRAERQDLIETFVSAYYDLCLNAKARLGSLYNPMDYPSAESIRSKFYFDWQYVALAIPDNLKTISANLYQAEALKAQAKLQTALDDIFVLLREDLLDKVSHLSERLEPGYDGKVKKLHTTAVTGLQEFLSTFQFRNITNDTELDAVCAKLSKLVAGVSADGLRNNETAKAELQVKLSKITGQLTKLVEIAPGRKIRGKN